MRRLLLVLVIAACEKSGPVESTATGSSSTPVVAPVIERGSAAGAATIGTDAGVAQAPADAAVVAVTPDAAVRPARDRVAMNMADAQAIADLLAADSGVIHGDMSARRPTSDLGTQIDNVRSAGRTVVIGGGAGRGGGAISGGAKVDSPGSANAPLGRVTISGKQSFDNTSLTVDVVVAKIQSAYMAGIKRCYKNFLRKDPSARGKVSLSISVSETGRSVSPKASGFAQEIDTCLESIMSGWRFPAPKDVDGEATDATFAIQLQMIPD